ncbi:MAG TPA: hypothetical protein GX497_15765 [Bacillus bacterium]|nr:hypothetical protein [Bacillus sp. (in: firmicutes)]
MSLKLVELQVALPRTQDVGKLQEELQQRARHTQDHLTAEHLKEESDKRKQVNKYDETTKSKLNNDHKGSNGMNDSEKNRKQKKQKQKQQETHHPYKGNLIDIEG